MRNLSFCASIAVAVLMGGGCASRSVEQTAERPSADTAAPQSGVLESNTATLVVHGMSCPLCASNVDKQLLMVPGVTGASVDMGSGEVKVTFAPNTKVSRKQLETAVHRSGFTLAEVRVP